MKKIAIDVAEVNGKITAFLPEAKFTQKKDQVTKVPRPQEDIDGLPWIQWGDRNALPTDIREKIGKVPMAGTAIYKLIAMMYGNGLAYYRNSDVTDGETTPPRARIPEVEFFLRKNRIKTKFLIPQFGDYRFYMNCFSEFILSGNRQQIVGLYHKKAEYSRLGKQNEKTLHVDDLIYSADFAKGLDPDKERRASIQLFRWYDEENFLRKLKGHKFAYHSKFETPGAEYYARPFWLGLFRKNGWIDASTSVPEIVNAMMRNQVILKYQILIPETYFEIRYKDWNTYTDEDRNKIIDALIKNINDSLSGTENAYSSITSIFKQDIAGNPIGKVEIIAIDDKMKNDNWVPSSDKADAQIIQTLGLHPSQVGLDNASLGGNGGSNQREGYNTQITINTIDQEIVLEPLNYVAEFNARTNRNWDITFYIDHTHHTTTNNQEDGLEKSKDTIDPK